MRVLVIQHAASEGPGTLGTFLESRGVDLATCRVHEGDPIPDGPGEAAAVISMGGPQSVLAGEEPGFFRREADLMVRAMKEGIPVLGICLGAQILARACGAEVRRAPSVEVGWSRVVLTPEGVRDPLFRGVDGSFDVFQWHGDTFDIPPGAVRLAEGAVCRNQAFRRGSCAYGLQFHLEATQAIVEDWLSGAGSCPLPAAPPESCGRTAQIVYLNFMAEILRCASAGRASGVPPAHPPSGEIRA